MDPALKRQRPRGASISGRLRSASDLCDDGVISQQEKGLLKDMIIVGNAQLDAAFAAYERGNVTPLKEVLEHGVGTVSGHDVVRKSLDIGLLSMGEDDKLSMLNFDDIPFDTAIPSRPSAAKSDGGASMKPDLPPRVRLPSTDFGPTHGKPSLQGSGLSTPALMAGLDHPFALGEDFAMGYLNDDASTHSTGRSRSNSIRNTFATPAFTPGTPWSSTSAMNSMIPSAAATHALMMGLAQHLPPNAIKADTANHNGSLSPFLSSLHAAPGGSATHASPSMSPFFGGGSPFYSAAHFPSAISDINIPSAVNTPSVPDVPTDNKSRSMLQTSARRRADSSSLYEPMASFRQLASGIADASSPWSANGSDTPSRASFDAGQGTDRKLSIDDAWRHASNVFDDALGAGGDTLLDVDDEVMDVPQRAHGKELAALSKRSKPPRPSGPRTIKPPPPAKPNPPPPPPPFDEAAYGGLTHVTRSRTAAITGYNMRRRRGDDDESEDGTGRTTRSSTRANGFVGAYSPEARRKRIQKFMEKRKKRVWQRKVKYDVRKSFADSRLRVKGRFVKKEDEELLRDLMHML